MIGALQQANAEGTTAPIGIELIGKADTLVALWMIPAMPAALTALKSVTSL